MGNTSPLRPSAPEKFKHLSAMQRVLRYAFTNAFKNSVNAQITLSDLESFTEDTHSVFAPFVIRLLLGNCEIEFGTASIDTYRWPSEVSGIGKFSEPYFLGVNRQKQCMLGAATPGPDFVRRLLNEEGCVRIGSPNVSSLHERCAIVYGVVTVVIRGGTAFFLIIRISPSSKFE
jgi:hypothetical protein